MDRSSARCKSGRFFVVFFSAWTLRWSERTFSTYTAIDVWTGGYAAELSYLESRYPTLAPEDLGTMGYLELKRNDDFFFKKIRVQNFGVINQHSLP